MDKRIKELDAELREAVSNGEITEHQADIEFKAMTTRWAEDMKLEQVLSS
jgi:hypothetical protein